ncbi:MAG TPA: zf-HC2 domain-containing protein, partial [Kofleriaceae bacterium]|nr:zf-HC2 domain-containing protein [Kofleriaceae bacterium]
MTDFCETLHAYVDGELDESAHSAFETHLASCDDCAAELPRLLALMAALDRAAEAGAQGTKRLV